MGVHVAGHAHAHECLHAVGRSWDAVRRQLLSREETAASASAVRGRGRHRPTPLRVLASAVAVVRAAPMLARVPIVGALCGGPDDTNR